MPRKASPQNRRDAVVAVYLPSRLAEKLRKIASEERRTASTQALMYIERALEGSGR